MNEAVSFDYVDLNQVDPNFSAVEEGVYTLRVVKAEKQDFVYKSGAKTGQPGQRISIRLAVVDHPTYSGRVLFESLFPNNFTLRALRRLMDATGVQQVPGTALEEWLQTISSVQPTFKAQVLYEKDRDGKVVLDDTGKPAGNAVNWKSIQPA